MLTGETVAPVRSLGLRSPRSSPALQPTSTVRRLEGLFSWSSVVCFFFSLHSTSNSFLQLPPRSSPFFRFASRLHSTRSGSQSHPHSRTSQSQFSLGSLQSTSLASRRPTSINHFNPKSLHHLFEMHFSTSTLFASLLAVASVAEASKCSAGSTHRRHHNKHRKSSHVGSVSHSKASSAASSRAAATSAATVALAANYKAASTKSASSSAASASASSSSSSSSSSSTGWGLSGLVKNGIYVGMLPDDGSGGGTSQTITTLNTALGGKCEYLAPVAPARLLFRTRSNHFHDAVRPPFRVAC